MSPVRKVVRVVLLGAVGVASTATLGGAPAVAASGTGASSASSASSANSAATEQPRLIGDGKVGTILTAPLPAWTLLDLVTKRQWKVAGQPVQGATDATYLIQPDDVGKAITVTYTGLVGLLTGVVGEVVDSLPTIAQPADAPGLLTAGSLSGERRVGTELAAVDPIWSVGGLLTTRQWLVDDQPVEGETGSTYVIRPSDFGKQITVTWHGNAPGYEEAIATADPVTATEGYPATYESAPRISGRARYGATLHATNGTWDSDGLTFTYQWLRGGVAIPEATGPTYDVVAADAGRSLAVEVTASRPAYESGTSRSVGVKVAKLASAVAARLPRTAVAGHRVKAFVVVSVPGLKRPTGTVTVRDGRRPIASTSLLARQKGTTTVVLPGLKAGKHNLTVTYGGAATVAPSRPRLVTLVVTKR